MVLLRFYAEQDEYIMAKCAEDVEFEDKVIRLGKVLKSVNYRPVDLSKIIK